MADRPRYSSRRTPYLMTSWRRRRQLASMRTPKTGSSSPRTWVSSLDSGSSTHCSSLSNSNWKTSDTALRKSKSIISYAHSIICLETLKTSWMAFRQWKQMVEWAKPKLLENIMISTWIRSQSLILYLNKHSSTVSIICHKSKSHLMSDCKTRRSSSFVKSLVHRFPSKNFQRGCRTTFQYFSTAKE